MHVKPERVLELTVTYCTHALGKIVAGQLDREHMLVRLQGSALLLKNIHTCSLEEPGIKPLTLVVIDDCQKLK